NFESSELRLSCRLKSHYAFLLCAIMGQLPNSHFVLVRTFCGNSYSAFFEVRLQQPISESMVATLCESMVLLVNATESLGFDCVANVSDMFKSLAAPCKADFNKANGFIIASVEMIFFYFD